MKETKEIEAHYKIKKFIKMASFKTKIVRKIRLSVPGNVTIYISKENVLLVNNKPPWLL